MSQPGSIRARIPAQAGDREIVIAGPRAAARPALVFLVINWAVNNLAALLAFLPMMFAVVVRTAGRRITGNHTWWLTAAPIAASVVPVVAALLLTGLVPSKGIAPIPYFQDTPGRLFRIMPRRPPTLLAAS